jgi:hypothetical protein
LLHSLGAWDYLWLFAKNTVLTVFLISMGNLMECIRIALNLQFNQGRTVTF